MMHKLSALFIILLSLITLTDGYAQIVLPKLISDGMILQRDADLKIWGWASPEEKVTLNFNEQVYNTITGNDGKWSITLPPHPAGGPYEMEIKGNNLIIIDDILLGDVWIGSGQSNMELTIERLEDKYSEMLSKVNNTFIRQFEVPDTYSFSGPNTDFKGGIWISADATNIYKFSAVGYFFAQELYDKYKVPIGFINTAMGGSPAQAWLSEEALKKFPDYYTELQQFKDPELVRKIEAENIRNTTEWGQGLDWKDLGIKYNWAKADLKDDDWGVMDVPGYWADDELGEVNGAVWFRKVVDIPAGKTGKPAHILLGRIVDADSVFINGVFVGSTDYQHPLRKYTVPIGTLKKGTNVIAVRVINHSNRGGFVNGKPYYLVIEGDSVDLRGPWKYQLGAYMEPMAAQTIICWKPGGLFNAMLSPLLEYQMKGVLWYQGESNTAKPEEYEGLLQALIKDWRDQWRQGEFPFIMVQLPNYMESNDTLGESNWAELRQAQLNTSSLPNIGLVVAIDAGEWNDIHPLDKEKIGQRLALQAKKIAYGDKDLVVSGPKFESILRKGNQLILSFSEIGSGLVVKDSKELKHFAIADEDGEFVWAKAKIDGDKVIVWNDKISYPTSVRYAWADNPDGANLYNKEGLPASPFEAHVDK